LPALALFALLSGIIPLADNFEENHFRARIQFPALIVSLFLFLISGLALNAQSSPNLTPFQPTGWDDKIVVSTSTGTNTDSSPIDSSDALYVDWAVLNNGKAISGTFNIELYVDEVLKSTIGWSSGLGKNSFLTGSDYSIGSLSSGSHTIRIKADRDDSINESDETDNEYTKTFLVGPGTPDIRIEPTTLTYTEPPEAAAVVQTVAASSAVESNVVATAKSKDWRILFRNGTLVPPEQANLGAAAAMAGPVNRATHVLMQFKGRLSTAEKNALADEGLKILRYVPNNAYWVKVSPGARNSLSTLRQGGGIRWSTPSTSVDKLSPEAREGKFPPNARFKRGRVQVQVLLFKDVNWGNAEDDIREVEGDILEWTNDYLLQVAIHADQLDTLAALDIVEWVEPATGPPKANNVVSAQRIQADDIQASPYSLDGSGVIVGVWDGGPIYAHTDFDTRLTVVDSGTADDHATHVGGTIAGSGAGDASAKGFASAADLWSYNWTNPTTEMGTGADSGVDLANHSWGYVTGWYNDGNRWIDYGSSDFGLYSATSVDWDTVVYTKDLIVFKSAGNDRNDGPDWPDGPDMDGPYDCIGQIATSKNIITMGATSDTDAMLSFSSWGPVDDGRVKPDLVANGATLNSTLTSDGYGMYSGTSMSTPSATGAAALLHQLNTQVTGLDMRADTCKAVLIHGASDLGRTGPDYENGWGLIDAQASADLLANQNYKLGSVADSGNETFNITLPTGLTELKVTLVWTDPPGSPAASIALVNDLDLVVTSPESVITRPWILDKDNPTVDATRGINSIDNVEQVLVSSPDSGQWTISVEGTAVPQGSFQDYTLVCEYLSAAGTPQSFIIYNDGNGILSVDPIVLGSAAEWISWSPSGAFDVPIGGGVTVTVTVDLDAAPAGTTTRRLMVTSNDPDESPYPAAVYIVTERAEAQQIKQVSDSEPSGLTVEWDCEEGFSYQLKYSDTMDPGSWTNIGPLQVPTTGQTTMSFVDTTTLGAGGKRFYVLEKLPE